MFIKCWDIMEKSEICFGGVGMVLSVCDIGGGFLSMS